MPFLKMLSLLKQESSFCVEDINHVVRCGYLYIGDLGAISISTSSSQFYSHLLILG